MGEDIGAATLMRPTLALEHFEHREFVVAQRIALDHLQVLSFLQTLGKAASRMAFIHIGNHSKPARRIHEFAMSPVEPSVEGRRHITAVAPLVIA
ncbi:MAG: hypothetical protein ACLPN5_01605 [Roseiarcus sp.]